jgi:hypothetical protein
MSLSISSIPSGTTLHADLISLRMSEGAPFQAINLFRAFQASGDIRNYFAASTSLGGTASGQCRRINGIFGV